MCSLTFIFSSSSPVVVTETNRVVGKLLANTNRATVMQSAMSKFPKFSNAFQPVIKWVEMTENLQMILLKILVSFIHSYAHFIQNLEHVKVKIDQFMLFLYNYLHCAKTAQEPEK